MSDRPTVAVYWLTRDSDVNGNLNTVIDVWLARPVRSNLPGGGALWLGPGDTGLEHRYCVWPIDFAQKQVGFGYPQTDRECVIVGTENP